MVLETVESFWKFVSKDKFPKLKDFATKCTRCLETHSYVSVSTFSTMKQDKCININRMADSFQLGTTNTGIDKGTIAAKKPRPQASHRWRFVINCCLLLCNDF